MKPVEHPKKAMTVECSCLPGKLISKRTKFKRSLQKTAMASDPEITPSKIGVSQCHDEIFRTKDSTKSAWKKNKSMPAAIRTRSAPFIYEGGD